jgi:2-polyprenyl-3-methyl-5-hydroxy-6-metoxy-1,4-benzoquinol methylase
MGQQLHLAALLLKRFNGAERIDILDYGCGYGTIVRALGGSRVSGCGFEPTTVVAALRSEGLDATDSLEELRSRGPFNGIILSDVLEHLPEPRETLKICHSLMRPGGWICVSVPYFGEALSNAVFDALRRGVVRTRELNPWEHLNYFSPTTLSNVLEGSGFAVDATVNPDLGFRSEARAFRRWGNAVKSAFRMFSFAAHAHLTTTTALARRK